MPVVAVGRQHREVEEVHQPLDAAGLVEALGELVQVAARAAGRCSARPPQVLHQRPRLARSTGRPILVASPEACRRRAVTRSRTGPAPGSPGSRRGPARLRSRATGAAWSAKPPRSAISGRSSRRKPGKLADPRLDVGAPLGGGLPGGVGLLDEAGRPASFSRASGASDSVGVTREVGQHPVLLREDGQHPVGLAQRRIGPVDRPRSAPRRGRRGPVPNSASRIEKRSRKGRRMMLFTRSVSTGELVRLDRQQALALAVALLDLRELGRRWWCRARTPRTSRRSRLRRGRVHLASARNGAKRASSIFRTTAAFLRSATSSDSITPTFAPATFTSSPGTRPVTLSKIARTS